MDATVRKARKKPVEIEYMVWPGGARNATPIIDWVEAHGQEAVLVHDNDDPDVLHIGIGTLEGLMYASPGDVIIKGVAGEFYPCKPAIFNKTYDSVGYVDA